MFSFSGTPFWSRTSTADRDEIEAFLRARVFPRGEQLRRRTADDGFASSGQGAQSYFQSPVMPEWTAASDFEFPRIESPEVFAEAILNLWRTAGLEIDADFARELSSLAARMKSNAEFDDEPPPFVSSL